MEKPVYNKPGGSTWSSALVVAGWLAFVGAAVAHNLVAKTCLLVMARVLPSAPSLDS